MKKGHYIIEAIKMSFFSPSWGSWDKTAESNVIEKLKSLPFWRLFRNRLLQAADTGYSFPKCLIYITSQKMYNLLLQDDVSERVH